MALTTFTSQPSSSSSNSTLKFLYSYNGKILPRPSDGLLRYTGGLTRVISVPRSITFTELMAKLESLCGYSIKLRCQLPNEDLDVLISVKSNDDLINIIEEYNKASLISGKELKIRAILSALKSSSTSSSESSTSSLSSSSSAEFSPLTDNRRRFVNQKAQIRRNFPARRIQQYAGDFCYYYYYPCHFQANCQHTSSFLLQRSNRLL